MIKPMLALAQKEVSFDATDVAKLSGRVDKKIDWHIGLKDKVKGTGQAPRP